MHDRNILNKVILIFFVFLHVKIVNVEWQDTGALVNLYVLMAVAMAMAV